MRDIDHTITFATWLTHINSYNYCCAWHVSCKSTLLCYCAWNGKQHIQKSPISPPKSHIFPQKSPTNFFVCLVNSNTPALLPLEWQATHPKEPYISSKVSYISAKEFKICIRTWDTSLIQHAYAALPGMEKNTFKRALYISWNSRTFQEKSPIDPIKEPYISAKRLYISHERVVYFQNRFLHVDSYLWYVSSIATCLRCLAWNEKQRIQKSPIHPMKKPYISGKEPYSSHKRAIYFGQKALYIPWKSCIFPQQTALYSFVCAMRLYHINIPALLCLEWKATYSKEPCKSTRESHISTK